VKRSRGGKSSPQSSRPRRSSLALLSRLRHVKLLLTDVDGVMTDGSVFITHEGEFKQFSIQDGLGLVLLRKCGVKVGWISARPSVITARRAEELKIDFLSQKTESKVVAAEEMLAAAQVNWEEVCFVGDDVVDLCLLRRVGLAVAVANAIDEVKAAAHYVTKAPGGHGAVREVVTMILKAQGKWAPLLRHFEQ
jgi:3-deoxy-D-manno-octulosonate 8-phosphate phosphatase (KDO 8-P phosphatase)